VCPLKLVFCHSLNVTAGGPTNKSLEPKTFCLCFDDHYHTNDVCYVVKFCLVRHSFTGTMLLYHKLGFGKGDFAIAKSLLPFQGCLPF
jgi:hypothetical protein